VVPTPAKIAKGNALLSIRSAENARFAVRALEENEFRVSVDLWDRESKFRCLSP
jgi:hypothetical protein